MLSGSRDEVYVCLRNDYENAENVNGERAVNTTFVVAQNATAARAAGYGDADYSLI